MATVCVSGRGVETRAVGRGDRTTALRAAVTALPAKNISNIQQLQVITTYSYYPPPPAKKWVQSTCGELLGNGGIQKIGLAPWRLVTWRRGGEVSRRRRAPSAHYHHNAPPVVDVRQTVCVSKAKQLGSIPYMGHGAYIHAYEINKCYVSLVFAFDDTNATYVNVMSLVNVTESCPVQNSYLTFSA